MSTVSALPKEDRNVKSSWALTDILYVFFMDMMLAGKVQALNRRVAHAIVSHLHKQGSEAHCGWQALPRWSMQTMALMGSARCLLSVQLRAEAVSALRLPSVGSPAGRLNVGHAIDKWSETHKCTAASGLKPDRQKHKFQVVAVSTALICRTQGGQATAFCSAVPRSACSQVN